MKNFKMKNVILGILIAVMSITCFAVVGVKLNNTPKYEKEQEIHIAGLEFEDGWNLISDADDYYLMTENTSTGKNAGAKYRLTNDITINPYKAKQDVFIGATLDGAGHNVLMDANAQPEISNSVVSSEPEYVEEYTQSSNPEYVEDESTTVDLSAADFTEVGEYVREYSGKEYTNKIYAKTLNNWMEGGVWKHGTHLYEAQKSEGFLDYDKDNGTVTIGTMFEYNAVESFKASITLPDVTWKLNKTGYDNASLFCFGYFGAVVGASITGLYITYSNTLTIDTGKDWDLTDYTVAVGGVAGYTLNSTIQGCIVEYAEGSKITVITYHDKLPIYLGSICGREVHDEQYKGTWLYFMDDHGEVIPNIVIGDADIEENQNSVVQEHELLSEYDLNIASYEAGDLNDIAFQALFSPHAWMFESINDGGMVATNSKEYFNEKCYWVLMDGINDGKIIQRGFAYLTSYTVTIVDTKDELMKNAGTNLVTLNLDYYGFIQLQGEAIRFRKLVANKNETGLPKIIIPDYDLVGYRDASGNIYYPGEFLPNANCDNITLTPIFEPRTYVFTFESNYGAPPRPC